MINSIGSGAFLQQVATHTTQNNTETKKTTKDEKVETSKVQGIKEALARGEYIIDIGGSAAKMARDLLAK